MCGIAGVISFDMAKCGHEIIQAMANSIAHRGPDDEGFLYKGKTKIECLKGNDTIKEFKSKQHINCKQPSSLILKHRLLSTIDLTSVGHQPFVYENLALVYNGEFYNYSESFQSNDIRVS